MGRRPTQDVSYDVSDITVSSPSGAPDSFTQTANQHGSVGSLDLRIGDPVQTVAGLDATYVISYELRGALRTFDGTPEFFWDVIGEDYPAIEQFTVTITAPEGVQKARCLMGAADCGADVTTDGSALLTGGDVPSGTVVSAVAALVPGAVADAEPTLARRLIEAPIVTGITSVVEVTDEGMTHVEQEMTYLLPEDDPAPTVRWTLPLRRPFSRGKDQVFRITNVAVDGATDKQERPLSDRARSETHQDMELDVTVMSSDGNATLTLAYDVEGAVTTDGGTSHARWALAPFGLQDADTIDFTWKLPADVEGVACTTMSEYLAEPRECIPQPALKSSGNTVSWLREGTGPMAPADAWIGSDLPAASVGHAAPILERGIEAGARRDKAIGIGGAIAAFGGTVVGVVLLTRIRLSSSRRWAGVAPGLTAPAGTPVRSVRRDDIVPVRFDEPDCSLPLAGLVLDGHPSTRHTGAVIVHMAVQGAVKVQSTPLTVTAITSEPLTDPLERQLYGQATQSDATLDAASLQGMKAAVEAHQSELLEDRAMFAASGLTSGSLGGRSVVVWGFIALMLVLFPVAWLIIPGWLGSWGFFIAGGVVVGCVAALNLTKEKEPRRALEPNGTALRDQVDGFRQYLSTAEARQLNFEADRDIYRRYLPWAVLFDLTQRWTRVCQDLADAGRIPALDTSFWVGAGSAANIAEDLSSLPRSLHTAGTSSSSSTSSSGFFSGGGSGGSSGFSGGSSGGGGGGGTSASSW